MKLYHGTSESVARIVAVNGLYPRSTTQKAGNWLHTIDSAPDRVYLTLLYAGYFANNATKEGERWGIIEIDANKLEEDRFFPDEDYLAQRYKDDALPKDLAERTIWFRNRLLSYRWMWEDSLAYLGTASYRGSILPEAITRITLFDPDTNPYIALALIDPTITIENRMLCGRKYKALTRWLMGEKISAESLLLSIETEPEVANMLIKTLGEDCLVKAQKMLDSQQIEIVK